MNSRSLRFCITAAMAVVTGFGCQHIGPRTIPEDRLAYNKEILTSWEQQAVLNLVRIRYDDLVQFVDVGPVVQTHSLQGTTTANLGASILPWDRAMNTLAPGLTGSRQITDSPNITYTPLAGSDYTKNLNRPLSHIDIFAYLIESGYKPDVLMPLTLRSINEIPSDCNGHNLNPNFKKLAQAIGCAHGHGDVNFYASAGSASKDTKTYMIISDQDSEFENCERITSAPVAYIREKLHLKAAATKFYIVARPYPTKETEIAVQTRSVIGAMRWLSSYVRVPQEHFNKQYAERIPEMEWLYDTQAQHGADTRMDKATKLGCEPDEPPLVIDSALMKPSDPFAAILYQGYWFSISKMNSKRSKRALIYLRTLLALADTGARPTTPVLTIPTR